MQSKILSSALYFIVKILKGLYWCVENWLEWRPQIYHEGKLFLSHWESGCRLRFRIAMYLRRWIVETNIPFWQAVEWYWLRAYDDQLTYRSFFFFRDVAKYLSLFSGSLEFWQICIHRTGKDTRCTHTCCSPSCFFRFEIKKVLSLLYFTLLILKTFTLKIGPMPEEWYLASLLSLKNHFLVGTRKQRGV